MLGVLIFHIWQYLAISLWELADFFLQILWSLLELLQQIPVNNLQFTISSHAQFYFACIGVLWLLAPKGFPGRLFGLFGFLPILFPISKSIPKGEIDFTLLDVGQGLSAVIETSNYILVYDTGP